MDMDADFSSLMAGLRAGDQAAAAALYRRYGPVIRAAARRAIYGSRLRDWYDSADFIQEVWARFIALPPDQQSSPTPRALAALLVRITHQKVARAGRRKEAEIARTTPGEGPVDGGNDPLSPVPPPLESAIAGETWNRLMDGIPAVYRPVMTMARDGYTHEEIATRLNVSVRTVERMVARARALDGRKCVVTLSGCD